MTVTPKQVASAFSANDSLRFATALDLVSSYFNDSESFKDSTLINLFAFDDDSYIVAAIVNNIAHLPEDIQLMLANHESDSVRASLVLRNNVSENALKIMTEDKNKSIGIRAIEKLVELYSKNHENAKVRKLANDNRI